MYARLVAPWLWLAAIATPLTRIFDVTERQRADLGMSVAQALALAVALIVGARMGDARSAVAAVSVTGVVLRGLQIALSLRIAGASLSQAGWDLVAALAWCAPFVAAGALAGRLTNSTIVLLIALVVAGIGYYALAVRRDRSAIGPPIFPTPI